MLKISPETLSDYYSTTEDKEEDCFSAVYGCFY